MIFINTFNTRLILCVLLRFALVADAFRLRSQPSQSRAEFADKLLHNLGFSQDEIAASEHYRSLSERFPHIVPDFMRDLYRRYRRSNLHNVSVIIEGQRRLLGAVEMVHCQRLSDIHTWPTPYIHKLTFKPLKSTRSDLSIIRELRLNSELFPRQFSKRQLQPNNTQYFSLVSIFDSKFQLIRERMITSQMLTREGWISFDISNNTDQFVFYLKILGPWKKVNNVMKELPRTNQKIPTTNIYPYYANVVTFYRKKNPPAKPVIPSHSSNTRRIKRDLSQYPIGHQDDCQRYPLVVRFKEVGWNRWIIAPLSYNAYYCKGNCPYPLSDSFNATNHAIIQLLVHGLKDIEIPQPCCVPYLLSPESLLYLNRDGDSLLRQFQEMSVTSCSCR